MFAELKKDEKTEDFVAVYKAYREQPKNFRLSLKINALWRAMTPLQQDAALTQISPEILGVLGMFNGKVVQWD